jgi:two-component system, chemotaxis family, protein-glutamate methylesterase/glutaminase
MALRERPTVVVADDSSFMRRLLADALAQAGFEVVGLAEDGDAAVALCTSVKPDVLTLDLAMPGLNGLEALRMLRRRGSTVPVVVVSAFSPAFGVRAIDTLAEGAFDLVAKPAAGEPLDPFLTELGRKVKAAARAAVAAPRATAARPTPARRPRTGGRRRAVIIASSTGGPRALATLVPHLPSPLGLGGVIVQHMPAGFTTSLAGRLDTAARLTVREAVEGDSVVPGSVLLAPGGFHLRLAPGGAVSLSLADAVGGLRPRADLTIQDAAEIYGADLVLCVLTGMGRDGLAGAELVKRAGGIILAEAESTCTVYGMPRAVVEAKLADDVLPIEELAAAVAAEAGA